MQRKRSLPLLFFILLLVLFGLFLLNLCLGSAKIGVREVVSAFLFRNGTERDLQILLRLRLPRALAAALLGGALAVSGYLLQTFFHNPIAGPFVLGISSGAKLFVALLLIFFLSRGMQISGFSMILSAFAGAFLSILFILLISRYTRKNTTLIICGVMIGYICQAVTEIVVTFADDSNIVNLHYWSLGSFSGIDSGDVAVAAVPVLFSVLFSLLLSKPLSAYLLGESYAQSVGVELRLLRFAMIFLSGLLSATVTAFAGPISFVGVAVPHLVKGLFQTAKPAVVIAGSFLGGGIFCLFCDLIARLLFAPTELSVGTVTAVFGAPVVIYLMLKRRERV